MGKNTKRTKEFIESIPDSKLTAFPSNGGTIFKDQDFRIDMQGVSISLHNGFSRMLQMIVLRSERISD
jgi:hypothetical protein